MASIENLEREVRRLRRLVNESVGSPATQKREAEALIGDGEGSERRGFAAACAASQQEAIRKALGKAIAELSRNPGCVDSPMAERDFRAQYASVPSDRLDEIISIARNGN
jgi:hypothetical protein